MRDVSPGANAGTMKQLNVPIEAPLMCTALQPLGQVVFDSFLKCKNRVTLVFGGTTLSHALQYLLFGRPGKTLDNLL